MEAKIFMTIIAALMLLTAAALAATGLNASQNVAQNANQVIGGSVINNSTINQSIAQRGSQDLSGTGLGGGSSTNQNIDQSAGQSIQGSSISGSAISQGIDQGSAQNIAGPWTNESLATRQNIGQEAFQGIQGSNVSDSTVGQSISQGASQAAGGVGTNASLSSSQNVEQGANQSLQGTTLWNASLSQSIAQGANQSISLSNLSYFVVNNQTALMTAEQRAAVAESANNVASGYPNNGMYIMPISDLIALNAADRGDLVVLNVGTGALPMGFSNLPVINIPLNQLTVGIGEIPVGMTIVVISDNDMVSAAAATLLRMQGFNAWAVDTGANAGAIAGANTIA